MNGKSGGQQAYEAFKAWRAERDPMMLVTDWTHPSVAHEGWEAAAAAVETEQVRLVREDRDQLRGKVLALVAELLEEAHAAPSRSEFEIKQDITVRLRKIAEPPS